MPATKEDTGLLAGNPWWGFFLLGFFFTGVSMWLYVDLTSLESEGGERQVQCIFALLYRWCGKWGVVIPPLLAGLALFVGGIVRLLQRE